MAEEKPEVVVQSVPEVPKSIGRLTASTSRDNFISDSLDRVRPLTGLAAIIPTWLGLLATAVLGALVLAAPAFLAAFYREMVQQMTTAPTILELDRWSRMVAWAWLSFFGSIGMLRLLAVLSQVLPFLTEENAGGESEFMHFIRRISWYVGLAVASLAVWLTAIELFPDRDKGSVPVGHLSAFTEYYVLRTAFALFVFSTLLLAEKFIVLHIGQNYHYDYYADRIEENLFCLAAIQRLRRKFLRTPRARKLLDAATENDSLLEEATELATLSFDGLRSGDSKQLVAGNLEAILTPEDAKRFFRLLDRDGNGDVTQREMIESFQQIYQERDNLAQSLTASDELITRLHGLGVALVVAITGALCLPIFDVSLANSVFSLVAFLAAAKTVLEGTILSIFDTIVFIFVSHPFDVGDRVLLDKKTFKVKQIGWWSSVFYSDGHTTTYLYNSALNGMRISNYRRSGPQAESFTIDVHMSTSREQLKQLEQRLTDFVKANPRDYIDPVDLNVSKLVNAADLQIQIVVRHRSNFQNGDVRRRRNALFLQAVRSTLEDLGIQLAAHIHHE